VVISTSLLAAAFFAFSMGFAVPLASAQMAGAPSSYREQACNQAATEHQLTGSSRRAFLSDCLSGKTTANPKTGPETCNARAKKADNQKLKGDARKTFLSGCLKGSYLER
jgi:hypothetical protein